MHIRLTQIGRWLRSVLQRLCSSRSRHRAKQQTVCYFALRTMTWFMRLFVIAIEERSKVFQKIKLALSGDINSLNRLLLNLKFEAYSIAGITLPLPTPEMRSSDND